MKIEVIDIFLFINNDVIYKIDKTYEKNKYKTSDNIVWYDGEFSFLDSENKDGYTKNFKWNGKEPVIEYEEIIPVVNEPSVEEKILTNTEKLLSNESALDVLLGVTE